MFEGTALEPTHTIIEGLPPPSAPPTPTKAAAGRPMLPFRIYLHTPARRSRNDETEDVFSAGLGTHATARCEACGAVFASRSRQAFWKHVTLNVCRKRQYLRGRSRLGMWWVGRGQL
ncbi:hypothetical protein AURDEDRAFT_188953 [Auricularia subglabra TFB-10046 SS5]|uniref:Uncharacterized protein n=1 Tax=Auricularia subglabra (strain TFB-10046 / SS5) TaxID=717982 RepID=J0WRP8_AURST|nr:hypothetical protein AURDEDRAFT_188953 [Auricularia subglabra TFB-10046 SS5]